MNKTIIWLLLLLTLKGFTQNNFEKNLTKGDAYSQVRSICQNGNGNYFSCGYNFFPDTSQNSFVGQALIYVCNQLGDTLKTLEFFRSDTSFYHNFGVGQSGIAYSCIINNTNECVTVAGIGGRNATNINDVDIFLVKLDSLGDTLLTKQISHPIPGDSAMVPYCIIQTFDGNYLICGWQFSFFSSRGIGFLLKVDSNFNPIWRKSFFNPNSNLFFDILESPDHGVLVSGTKYDPNDANIADPILFKVDSAGNELWRINQISVGADYGSRLTKTPDGNFIQSTSVYAGNDSSRYRFIKLNYSGIVLSTKVFLKTYTNGAYVCKTTNNKLIATGAIENNHSTGTVDAFVMGLDNNGDSLWYRQYGGIWPDFAWDAAPTSDGGIILCGETYNNLIPNTNSNAWLLKLDSLGLLITGVNELSWTNNIIMDEAYPNPSTSHCNIHTFIPENISNKNLGKTGYELQLYNLQSKPIQYIPINSGSITTILNTEQLASGTYLAVLVVNGYNVKNQKIVVIK